MKLRKVKKYIRSKYKFLTAIIIALLAVFFLYLQLRSDDLTPEALNRGSVKVGRKSIDGYQQIFYSHNDKHTYITDGKINHSNPKISGNYIAWLEEINGQFQVVLYDVIEKTKLQLSFLGINSAISMDQNKVAWESQQDGKAVIRYFDGEKVRTVSGKYNAIRPFVKDSKLLYAQQLEPNTWQTVEYDADTEQSKIVSEGDISKAAWPRYEDNQIKTGIEGSAKFYY